MTKANKRPNFLFFMTDQHRADWLGCYGHPVVKTPSIDAIAASGTRFNSFYVASPVCMPNRASFMTGRYPSVHGLKTNGARLPLSANTFVDVLAEAGYKTASIGKSHLQSFTGIAPFRNGEPVERAIEEAWRLDEGNYYQEEPEKYTSDDRYEFETPYYGFQQVEMVTKHGDKTSGHYGQWFRENVPNWKELHDPSNELPHKYICPQAYRTPIADEHYNTAWIADRAIDYINKAEEDEPFFAFVSFPDPHHPFNPPGKYWDMYQPEEFEVGLPYSAHQNPTPPMQWLEENYQGASEQMTMQTAMRIGDRELQEAMALTAGMISCVDTHIGRVVDALKASGQYENTVICFNADHGDYLGDFNMLLKGLLPMKSLNRAPFIWSDPADRTGKSTNTLASTVDIASTILQRAGLNPYHGIQGKSFLHTLERGEHHRHETMIEFNDGAAKFGFEKPARVRSLITHDWRISMYRDQSWGELYDLNNDPNETTNLWDDAEFRDIRLEMTERLAHQLMHQMDESPLPQRLA